MNLKKYKSI